MVSRPAEIRVGGADAGLASDRGRDETPPARGRGDPHRSIIGPVVCGTGQPEGFAEKSGDTIPGRVRQNRGKTLVPKVGLEPTRVLPHRILSPARLPFRHFGNTVR